MNIAQINTTSFNVPGFDYAIQLNPTTLITTWVIMAIILFLGILVGRTCKMTPGKLQTAVEFILGFFVKFCKQTLGKDWKKFFPLVMTLFFVVLFSNWAGIIPGVKSPTADLNTCLGFGSLVFIIVHAAAIAHKGFIKYLKGYFEPFFLFFPLNVLGEFGKVISHSFRLFGNMFAGGIILALIAPITFKVFGLLSVPKTITSPLVVGATVFAQGFYGLFMGAIQAFVFAVLALTYIAVARD